MKTKTKAYKPMAKPMAKPMKGGTPKKITTKNAPGGPQTPGAKKKAAKKKAKRTRGM